MEEFKILKAALCSFSSGYFLGGGDRGKVLRGVCVVFCFQVMAVSKPEFKDCSKLLYSKSGSEACDYSQTQAIRPKYRQELCISLQKRPLQLAVFKSPCAIKCIIFFFSHSQNALGNKRRNLSLNTKQSITSFLMWFEMKMDGKINPKLSGELVVRNTKLIHRNTEQ